MSFDSRRHKIFLAAAFIFLVITGGIALARGQDEGYIRHYTNQDDQSGNLSVANTIIPGERIGVFSFRMTEDDLGLLAGDPDAVYDRSTRAFSYLGTGETYRLYREAGLAFVMKDHRILRIIALSPQYRLQVPAAAGGASGAFGIGDSEERIKELFPANAVARDAGQNRQYLLQEKGIAFIVTKESRTIWEIHVFPIRN